jgi:hypothetical protein
MLLLRVSKLVQRGTEFKPFKYAVDLHIVVNTMLNVKLRLAVRRAVVLATCNRIALLA